MSLSATYRTAFIALGVAGAFLLQGLLAIDGGLLAILKSIYHGQFPWGKTMTLIYTGLPIVDQFANIQVAFWAPVVSVAGVPRLQACMLCASLQTAGVWAVIEGLREDRGWRHWIIRYAPLYVFLWQGVGTAIFLPFYFLMELEQYAASYATSSSKKLDPRISLSQAIALLPATIFSLVQPFAMVFLPPSGITEAQHQTYLAVYQFGPLIGYALICTFSSLLSSSSSPESQDEQQGVKDHVDAKWIKITYAVCGLLSAAVHIGCLYAVLFAERVQSNSVIAATNGPLSLGISPSLTNLFIPSFSRVWGTDKETLMTQASLFFLQWDFIICALACALYCVGIMRVTSLFGQRVRATGGMMEMRGKGSFAHSAVMCLIWSVACVMFSPGMVVSGVLFMREKRLRETFLDYEETSKGAAKT